ncbi:hypothetical protein EGJ52_24970 [Pseudomonas luteola]|uniref:hypothetical protein n=1 Tax=Pseudomonas luteola TaxID=47886 RepID=UPI000F773724|nr:hypothetical protein [Pseudomonas luteola]RRW39147.1 hypothetical protein EGJ52_24970 [Pseudomonas luteola]
MMLLSTRTVLAEDGSYLVYWWTGLKKKGVLSVQFKDYIKDVKLAVELVAIRHLLYFKQVFNRYPITGAGIYLSVTDESMVEILGNGLPPKHLYPYAALLGRLYGSKTQVPNERDLPFNRDDPDFGEVEYVYPTEEYRQCKVMLETPALGRISLTQHAVDAYLERVSSGKPRCPWSSLARRLSHPELRLVPMPERIRRHKLFKFGSVDEVETWGHETSKFLYLLIRDGEQKTVVTCFERRAQDRI